MKTNQKEIQKLKDKTFIISLTISKDTVKDEYQKVLKDVQSNFESKGFRKGKVPLDIVQQEISQEKMIHEVASSLISKIYNEKIKEHNLNPIVQPHIDIKNPPVSLEKEWQVEITSCELPEIKLEEKYYLEIKKINSDKKEGDKVNKILDTLIKHSQIELPDILVENSIENNLSQLIDQTNQAGITVDQYLKSKKTNLEEYKKTLKSQITQEWTINLAIHKIAQDQKIEITKKDIEDLLTKNPNLSSNVNLVQHILIQQKVIDYLQALK